MKVAVTAASGRLGHAILPELVKRIGAANVVAIVRDPARVSLAGIEKRAGDYADVAGLARAFAGIDTVVMISAPVKTGTDRVQLHRNVIAAAKQAGVRKLVYTSVIGNGREEGTWFWPTQQVNRQAEADLAESGLEWVVARNGLYLELDLNHIRKADETGVYRNPGGTGRCGYVTIPELGYATALLATDDRHNGQVYTLAGEPVTQQQIVETANRVFGLKVRYEVLTSEQNVERFMQDPTIAVRGIEVARMLTGCFQAMHAGGFDCPSDWTAITGEPPPTLEAQMRAIKARLEA